MPPRYRPAVTRCTRLFNSVPVSAFFYGDQSAVQPLMSAGSEPVRAPRQERTVCGIVVQDRGQDAVVFLPVARLSTARTHCLDASARPVRCGFSVIDRVSSDEVRHRESEHEPVAVHVVVDHVQQGRYPRLPEERGRGQRDVPPVAQCTVLISPSPASNPPNSMMSPSSANSAPISAIRLSLASSRANSCASASSRVASR